MQINQTQIIKIHSKCTQILLKFFPVGSALSKRVHRACLTIQIELLIKFAIEIAECYNGKNSEYSYRLVPSQSNRDQKLLTFAFGPLKAIKIPQSTFTERFTRHTHH